MEIRLGESDAFLHEGVATMLVVHVTLDSGKKIQFPFKADLPIFEIYKAVEKISEEKIKSPAVVTEALCTSVAPKQTPLAVESQVLSTASSIGREDLVKCVKLYPRGEGATVDLKVGDIYRVLKIVKNGYDVIDDKAATPMRLFVFTDEVEFYQKRKPPVPKVLGKPGKSALCPVCNADMIYYKEEDGRFMGECMVCTNRTELIDGKGASSNSEAQAVQPAAA
jgi:hypothetical protein